MKLYAPDYYTKFVCIADKCRHSCCIGWEIDIDDDTFEYYKTIDGNLGERLKKNISAEDGTAHFILDKNERCPFLNKNGLCDIILQLGEGALCQICDDHPRFRNFYSDRTEIGLGMCCEAAVLLILSQKEKIKLFCIENDGEEKLYPEEEEFLNIRQQIFEILTDRTLSVDNRVKNMLEFCEVVVPEKSLSEWADFYLSIERLDENWTVLLQQIKSSDIICNGLPENKELSVAFEQLLCYFVYRHLADSLDDDRMWERVAFAALSYYIIRSLCAMHYSKNGALYIEDVAEYVRIYSSEIEYSEDNMEKLLDILS